jgi:hypothetical protein
VLGFGERGLYVGNLVRPKGVAADDEGNFYVVESMHDTLLVFDREARLLMSLTGSDNEAGHFYLPAGVWVDRRNRVFVATCSTAAWRSSSSWAAIDDPRARRYLPPRAAAGGAAPAAGAPVRPCREDRGHLQHQAQPVGLRAGDHQGHQRVADLRVLPHAARAENIPNAPLWNRKLSGATYSTYNSSSIERQHRRAVAGPGGLSRLCLSCHDGTMAIGNVTCSMARRTRRSP